MGKTAESPAAEADRGASFARLLAEWRAVGRSAPALIMGIINVTPDSFSEGGLFADTEAAIAHAGALAAAGAAILDIGGESTRPNAIPVPAHEEMLRALPVIRAASETGAVISVDTVKPSVAEAALSAGAHVVNDIRGLQGDPEMAHIAARHGAGVVIMHNPGFLGSSSGTEGDPVSACLAFFERSLAIAAEAGIAADRIVLDPGFGFGKTVEQSLELLARLPELTGTGHPILVGISRKSFIGKLLGREPDQRLIGTLATHVAAALGGAAILRVHDVAEHVDAARMAAAIRGAMPASLAAAP